MFGWIGDIFHSIAIGISGVLIGIAGFLAPAPVATSNIAITATSTPQIATSTVASSTPIAPIVAPIKKTTTTLPSNTQSTPTVTKNICNGQEYPSCSWGTFNCLSNGQPSCGTVAAPTITQTPQTATPQPTQTYPQTAQTPTLSITFGQEVLTYFSTSTLTADAYITWDTNIPTDSKVFFTLTGQVEKNQPYCLTIVPISLVGPPRIFPSDTGNSTHHFIHIGNLTVNYQYTYEIEAIAGLQDKKISKTFYTSSTKFALCPTN